MFTGIIEEVGWVRAITPPTTGGAGKGSAVLDVACRTVVADARPGDSISVNGSCLTVTALASGFTAVLMGETLDRTALGSLTSGAPVHLERALRAGDRLGGHLVQGHVDGVATVVAVEPRHDWTVMTFSLPPELARYVVEKGSVAVDGTSLTVMRVDDDTFSVGLIPHTLARTAFASRSVGDLVNLEVDLVAKYIERLLRAGVHTPWAYPGAYPWADKER